MKNVIISETGGLQWPSFLGIDQGVGVMFFTCLQTVSLVVNGHFIGTFLVIDGSRWTHFPM